uniref:Reverse transcriptase zinc-binding domain-containing protein n=1 Tax=Rhipicephalus pulchellus TaxID=72859 RepID=L7M3S5_RHIPC
MPVRPSVKSFFFQLHTNTLPVKTWLEERGISVPWSVNCSLCNKPETVEHAFIECWDAVFHWDILQRTLRKDLPITPYGIRFLPTLNEDTVPYDMFMLLSLHCLWKSRMDVRHMELNPRPVREYFIESLCYMKALYSLQEDEPPWMNVLNELVNLKRF